MQGGSRDQLPGVFAFADTQPRKRFARRKSELEPAPRSGVCVVCIPPGIHFAYPLCPRIVSSLSSSTWFCSWPLTLPTTRHPFLPSFAPRLLAHHSGPHTRPWSRSRDLTSAPLASARRQLVGSSRNTAASHRRSATWTEQTAWPTRIALRAAVTEPGRGMLQDQDHVEPPVMGVQGVVAWAVSP